MSTLAPVRLSKSKFVAGLQCLKRLYLQVHQPELAGEAGDEQEARFEQGHEVGILAQAGFPGGVLVDSDDLDAALLQTSNLLADSSVPAIFEATFRHRDVLVRVDILQRRRRNRWRLIEVKSSVGYKDHYLYDVAIQGHVVQGCGIDLSSACLMHLNRDYVYDGERYDPAGLFYIKDLTRQVRRLDDDLPKLVRAQRRALARPEPPDIAPGPHCVDPYDCEFYGHCNPALPETHISSVPRLSPAKRQMLLDQGVTLIGQIPDDFPLTEVQARICTAVTTARPWISTTLSKELSRLKYPRYFMDFETLNPAIPRHAGMRPYQQIPFQWSVHRQIAPGAELEHFEFLADDDRDPRRDFVESLIKVLGRRGPIVVYNEGFESQRLAELADQFSECRRSIEMIRSRLWDLLPFIKRHFYHPQFHGSYSLKSVLPALVPDLSYDGMDVAHGGEAGWAWDRMIRGEVDAVERRQLRSALLAYCSQDTLAMEKILRGLKSHLFKTQAVGQTL